MHDHCTRSKQLLTQSQDELRSAVFQLPDDLLLLAGGAHGSHGKPGPGAAEEGDGELRDVGEDEGHHIAPLRPQPPQGGPKLGGERHGHLVCVLAPGYSINCVTGYSIVTWRPVIPHTRAGLSGYSDACSNTKSARLTSGMSTSLYGDL